MKNEIEGNIKQTHIFERKIEDGDEVEFVKHTYIETDTGNFYRINNEGKVKKVRGYVYQVMINLHLFYARTLPYYSYQTT